MPTAKELTPVENVDMRGRVVRDEDGSVSTWWPHSGTERLDTTMTAWPEHRMRTDRHPSTVITFPDGSVLNVLTEGRLVVRWLTPTLPVPRGVSLWITPTIAGDTFLPTVISSANGDSAGWEVLSDRYINESEFSYTVDVRVTGRPGDDWIEWSSGAPVVVPMIPMVYHVQDVRLKLPAVPADKLETVNDYIKANSA